MNTCKVSLILPLVERINKLNFRKGQTVRRTSRGATAFGRLSLHFALVALAAGFLLATVSSPRVFSHGSPPSKSSYMAEESLALFSSGALDTPKTVFNRGEKAWAQQTGASLPSLGARQRRFQWIAPDGTVKEQQDITANNQADDYQISPTAQLGIWLVKTVDNSNAGFAVAEFVVRDPANIAANLSVSVFGSPQVPAGGSLTHRVQVTNSGPDTASDVQLTDVISGGAVFESLTGAEGWSCLGGGTTTCSIGSLPKGETAVFTLVYQISDTLPAGALITNAASVASTTTELSAANNEAEATATVTVSTCTFTCPTNLTQAHDAGTNGAVVNYSSPGIGLGCDPVICNPASGSVFPAGTTAVVCSSGNGGSCSFNVTVTGALTIMLEGPDPLTVECHTAFNEPGATARDDSGNTYPVTSSVGTTVDLNTPGTYTINYTAMTGSITASATRVVEVVDTTPPVITLNGANPLIVPRYATFTDPGATAQDACAGPKPVTASGSVNTSVTGIYTITYTSADGVAPGANTSTATRTVIVPYEFVGFLPPIHNLPELNSVNAGRAIPVKFRLGGNKGLDIFAPGYPQLAPLNCGATTTVDVLETATAGESELSYDPGADQYSYVWKTEKAWEGSCRQLVVKLNDGSVHVANFTFR